MSIRKAAGRGRVLLHENCPTAAVSCEKVVEITSVRAGV